MSGLNCRYATGSLGHGFPARKYRAKTHTVATRQRRQSRKKCPYSIPSVRDTSIRGAGYCEWVLMKSIVRRMISRDLSLSSSTSNPWRPPGWLQKSSITFLRTAS